MTAESFPSAMANIVAFSAVVTAWKSRTMALVSGVIASRSLGSRLKGFFRWTRLNPATPSRLMTAILRPFFSKTMNPRPGIPRRVVRRPDHVRGAVEVLDDVFLVVAAFAGGDRIDAELVEVHGVVLADAEPARGPFSVRNDEVDGVLLPDLREELLHDPHAGLADDLSNEEDADGCHLQRIATGGQP